MANGWRSRVMNSFYHYLYMAARGKNPTTFRKKEAVWTASDG